MNSRHYPECPFVFFTHVPYNRRLSVSDSFSATGNTLFGLSEGWRPGRVCKGQEMQELCYRNFCVFISKPVLYLVMNIECFVNARICLTISASVYQQKFTNSLSLQLEIFVGIVVYMTLLLLLWIFVFVS